MWISQNVPFHTFPVPGTPGHCDAMDAPWLSRPASLPVAFQLSTPGDSQAGFGPSAPLDPHSTLIQPASREANIYGLSQCAPLLSAFPLILPKIRVWNSVRLGYFLPHLPPHQALIWGWLGHPKKDRSSHQAFLFRSLWDLIITSLLLLQPRDVHCF